jgi:hypothetical protein
MPAWTVTVPLQVAVFPLQFPELADTDMSVYMPPSGLLQTGAFVQLRPLVTDVEPALLLQVTAGAVITVPSPPTNVADMSAQASVYVIGTELELGAIEELLGGALELLLCTELDEGTTAAELELGATDELLCTELDEGTTAAELELVEATDELLVFELDEGNTTGLLELGATDELLGLTVFIAPSVFLLSP